MAAFRRHPLAEGDFPRGLGADEDGGEAEPLVEAVVQLDPAFGQPIFFGVAGAGDQRDPGAWERTEKFILPRPFGRLRAQIPFHGLAGNLEVVEKLKEMLLHVIHRARGKVAVVDEPIELPGPGGIEPHFDRASTESGQDRRFQVTLQVEDHIKGAIPQ